MSKRISILWVISIVLCLVPMACSRHAQERFELHVQFQAAPNTVINLEELGINKATLIASVTTDSVGKAVLSGVFEKPELYRLSLKNKGQLFIIIDQEATSLEIGSVKNLAYTITGSPRSQQLQDFMKEMYRLNHDMVTASFNKTLVATEADAAVLIQSRSPVPAPEENLKQFVKQNADTATLLPLALFYANFLPLDENARYLKQFAIQLGKRFEMEETVVKEYQKTFAASYKKYISEQHLNSVDTLNAVNSSQ